ncbi:hypothetical protein [Nocardia sp. BMG51109]|uniref:hypothetical protein n=1 Tax=Nocardia sp. BMG51109 TaxID=1056816 RepID=UPI000466678F|nr:hypothetical protein [Nocardia sp. BMG51109]
MLCDECVERVRADGPWQVRRPLAAAARRGALIARHPELTTVNDTPAVVQLRGRADDRLVEIRLRIKLRRYSDERYIFHVEYPPSAPVLTAAGSALPGTLPGLLWWDSPTLTRTEVRWLRVAFRHLGKLDTMTALEHLVAVARSHDAGQPSGRGG